MATARFLFHEPLSAFLKRELRGHAFAYECARAASLKNAIEALGVPHTEAGAVMVNGAPATLQRTVREGDVIEIHPVKMESGSDPDYFLADAHLGGLARFLRMLGFDTLHDQAMHDDEIRRIAGKERRVVLTRDRELLKCRDIVRGCYVRALKPEAQLREVAARYGLAPRARPFSLCLRCNLPLEPVEKAAVAAQVPQKVLSLNEAFSHCRGCDRIYWPGSHYQRMKAALGAALPSG
jgi:hypothetical protein